MVIFTSQREDCSAILTGGRIDVELFFPPFCHYNLTTLFIKKKPFTCSFNIFFLKLFLLILCSLVSLMDLLCQIADSYKSLVTYDLGKAVRLFQDLPPHHLDTPWVLSQVARAYFSAERFKKVGIS